MKRILLLFLTTAIFTPALAMNNKDLEKLNKAQETGDKNAVQRMAQHLELKRFMESDSKCDKENTKSREHNALVAQKTKEAMRKEAKPDDGIKLTTPLDDYFPREIGHIIVNYADFTPLIFPQPLHITKNRARVFNEEQIMGPYKDKLREHIIKQTKYFPDHDIFISKTSDTNNDTECSAIVWTLDLSNKPHPLACLEYTGNPNRFLIYITKNKHIIVSIGKHDDTLAIWTPQKDGSYTQATPFTQLQIASFQRFDQCDLLSIQHKRDSKTITTLFNINKDGDVVERVNVAEKVDWYPFPERSELLATCGKTLTIYKLDAHESIVSEKKIEQSLWINKIIYLPDHNKFLITDDMANAYFWSPDVQDDQRPFVHAPKLGEIYDPSYISSLRLLHSFDPFKCETQLQKINSDGTSRDKKCIPKSANLKYMPIRNHLVETMFDTVTLFSFDETLKELISMETPSLHPSISHDPRRNLAITVRDKELWLYDYPVPSQLTLNQFALLATLDQKLRQGCKTIELTPDQTKVLATFNNTLETHIKKCYNTVSAPTQSARSSSSSLSSSSSSSSSLHQ